MIGPGRQDGLPTRGVIDGVRAENLIALGFDIW